MSIRNTKACRKILYNLSNRIKTYGGTGKRGENKCGKNFEDFKMTKQRKMKQSIVKLKSTQRRIKRRMRKGRMIQKAQPRLLTPQGNMSIWLVVTVTVKQ